MKVDLIAAQLQPRVLAGALDGVVLLALCAAYFLVPVALLGMVLPMWGVLAAIIGYSVIPLAVFRQTLGMRLFHLELTGNDGHAVGLGDVLFRELIGRGWFPAAFLFNLAFGYVTMLLGWGRFAMPGGLQVVFVMASGLTLFASVLGHLLVLGVKDRRSIADLMARSWVVPQQPRPLPTDADELEELRAAGRRSVRNVVIAELVVLSVGLAAPWLLTRKTESTEAHAARLLRQRLETQFKANPQSESTARSLAEAYRATQDWQAASKVEEQHQAALEAEREKRFGEQVAALDTDPGNESKLLPVLEALERKGRLNEAKTRYGKFVELNHDAPYRAGWADWLSAHGFTDEGVKELETLVKDEPDFEGVHKYLARALVQADRLKDAQEEYQRELVRDPTDEDALEAMEELNAELGPLPKARIAALQKEVKAKR
jgi:uncharacterized RDD family membrane protein YckC